MPRPLFLHADRYFPAEPAAREAARRLFSLVATLPLLSPHGHADPAWFAADAPFEDATSLLLWPDHYLLRMLVSQGIAYETLGIAPLDGGPAETDRRAIWRVFAAHYRLFRATPSGLWLNHVFHDLFGMEVHLDAETADLYYERIGVALARPDFRPRALFERFGIEKLATTEGALDPLASHAALAKDWPRRIITTFRPDDVTDPDRDDFTENVETLGALTHEDPTRWTGFIAALAARRAFFRAHGATATDHGFPSARTVDLPLADKQALLDRVLGDYCVPGDSELFRAQMLTEMALLSCEDGMAMQLHPGSWRNHSPFVFRRFGRDKGGDIPTRADFVGGLKPLLDRVGFHPNFTLILFTLDESAYSRELAPLAGFYPAVKLGSPWWFNDSPEGILRFRRSATETAGFSNLVGFTDDTRAFLSIPARHDLARRMDCAHLAELVVTHRLEEDDAAEIAVDLAYNLAKAAYRL